MKATIVFIFSALLLFVGQSANAQEVKKFTGVAQKQYARAQSLDFVLDFSEAEINYVAYGEFIEDETNERNMKRFENELYAGLCKGKRNISRGTSDSNAFELKICVEFITKKAGINCHGALTYKKTGEHIPLFFKVKDGRWADFDKLLLENAEELAGEILKAIK